MAFLNIAPAKAVVSMSDQCIPMSTQNPPSEIVLPEGTIEDTDSESDDHHAGLTQAQRAVQTRQEQKAGFQKWLAETQNYTEVLRNGALTSSEDYGQSMGDHEISHIEPRLYQEDLYNRACEDNIIAVLPTGSGKTQIAIMLLKRVRRLDQMSAVAVEGIRGRTSFFLVDRSFLAKQQYRYLCNECGNRRIACCTGSDGTDWWSKEVWEHLFQENDIVVSTAEVLVQCLMHGFIKTKEINLLIFDEAHHTKKDHPYARIIKDYYLAEKDRSLRPRIFSMTASPVDAKTDVVEAAKDLETLLHSKIATSSDPDVLKYAPRPEEVEWQYQRLSPTFETPLCCQISAECNVPSLRKNLVFARRASSELGPACADMGWNFNVEDDEWDGSDVNRRRRWRPAKAARSNGTWDEEIRKISHAEDLIRNHRFQIPLSMPLDLSSKVLVLRGNLEAYFATTFNPKCIVFVNQRATALVLRDLFLQFPLQRLRPAAFLGNGPTNFGLPTGSTSVSASKQEEMLAKFNGTGSDDLNCLFSTSVAEEGLDIQGCNLVVRFDLCTTMIQYVQSRGRAREPKSIFVHMVEIGNQLHRDLVNEAHGAERVLKNFCDSLPADRILRNSDADIAELIAKDRNEKHYTIETSGAKLNPRSALVILENFANSLRYENSASAPLTYSMRYGGGTFQYKVVLPEESPFRGSLGDTYSRKIVAKQSAAFHTCRKLYELGHLDEYLMSTFRKRRPMMANAKLSIKSMKKDQYEKKVKPHFWGRQLGAMPTQLYATIVSLKPSRILERRHDPFLLLSRTPLPSFPHFPVYLEADVVADVQSIPVHSALCLAQIPDALDILTAFTFRVFEDLFNKTYERNDQTMPYWFAPIKSIADIEAAHDQVHELIDLDLLKRISRDGRTSWVAGMDTRPWENSLLVDGWSGKYRYFSASIAPELNILSVPPDDPPTRRHKQTILDYCLSAFGSTRSKIWAVADYEQPIFHAKLVPLKRNLFEKMNDKERNALQHDYAICPQALELSPLPIAIVKTFIIFPTIISRFESYLIALEACHLLDLDIGPELALEAVTKDSDNTEEHHATQIHFRRGMGRNYERLEFIGDTFLKAATSISLFTKFPNENEFDFHVSRMEMICNQNLFDRAVERAVDLPRYIRTEAFNRRTWYPHGLVLLHGKGAKTENDPTDQSSKQALAQKTIADVCEALIGAAYLTTRERGDSMDMAVKAVTRLVHNRNHEMEAWCDYSAGYELPSYQVEGLEDLDQRLKEFVLDTLGYRFRYPRLLQSAFTHPSDPWAGVPSYQRLEFLGDSLYDLVCVEFLFKAFPDRDPQWLTEHKMAMVSNKFLAAVAVELDFDHHLQYNTVSLQAQISKYRRQVTDATSGGRYRTEPDYWTMIEQPPKAISDMVEAYIGAIFIDSDFDYKVVEDFFEKHIRWHFEDMTVYDSFANKHPTTFLHHRLTETYQCLKYRLMPENVGGDKDHFVVAVVIHGAVIAWAEGASAKYTRIRASEAALRVLDGLSAGDFRSKYGCDCHKSSENEDVGIQADSAI